MAIKFVGSSGTSAKPDHYAQHLSTPIKASTSMTKKQASSSGEVLMKAEEETLNKGVMIPAHELILLTIEGGSTVNLGNYESARIGVSLRVPATKDTLNEVYAWGTDWIGEKIKSVVKEAKGM